MNKLIIFLAIFNFNIAFAVDISGLYDMNFDGDDNYVEIFQKNKKYYAVAFANKKEIENGENNKLKVENSKTSVFVWNLVESKEGKFTGGQILNVKNNHVYYVSAKYDGGDILQVKVSKDKAGVFGMTLKWRKLNENEIKLLQEHRVNLDKLYLPQ